MIVSLSALAATACVDLDIPTGADYGQEMLSACGGAHDVRGERGAPSVEGDGTTRSCTLVGGAPQPPRR